MNRKATVLSVSVLIILIGGVLLFRALTKEKHVFTHEQGIKAVVGNLRMIASVGQQYLLENDVNSFGYSDMVEMRHLKLHSVFDESYSDLEVHVDGGVLEVDIGGGEIVSFPY